MTDRIQCQPPNRSDSRLQSRGARASTHSKTLPQQNLLTGVLPMPHIRWTRVLRSFVFGTALVSLAGSLAAADPTWKRTKLDDKFRSEGVAVADFNHDGKADIAAGSVYYAAPDWKMISILEQPAEFDPHGYSQSFNNFAEDLNGDGWADLVVVSWPGKETFWFENPREAGGPWKRHVLTPVTSNESPQFLNFGDDKRALVCGVAPDESKVDGPEREMAVIRRQADPNAPWAVHAISAKDSPGTQRFAHGLGGGDVNSDGRLDIIVPQGWWESPADPSQTPWNFHPAELGVDGQASDMHALDVDGDGDSDIIASSAHGLGIRWNEQTPEGWKQHEIDRSFSQTHSMCVGDINRDGLPDVVTGKRYWAHGPGGDIDPGAPAVVVWFELKREGGQAKFIPHAIDADSGVGTQFQLADVNGDGLLDVVTSNKKGVYYHEQVKP